MALPGRRADSGDFVTGDAHYSEGAPSRRTGRMVVEETKSRVSGLG